MDREDLYNLQCVNDDDRAKNLSSMLSCLEKADSAARKIQTAWRFFSQKNKKHLLEQSNLPARLLV